MTQLLDAAQERWGLTATGRNRALLHAVAARHGTPLYLYSGPLIDRQVARLRAALPAQVALLYAVKANPHPAVLGRLTPQVDGCDVTSAAEIALARQAGVVGKSLSFAGPGKTDEDLAAALAADALVVLESIGEARRLAALAAGRRGKRPRVALRLNPPFSLSAETSMGGGPRPFGVDSEQAPAVLAELATLPLAFEGFHVYAGSRCLDAGAIAAAQRATLDLAGALAPFAPAPVVSLNLGGGFGIPCFPGERPLDLAALGESMRQLAREAAVRLPAARLTLELGRYLVGEAGLYVSRVLDRKVSRGRTFLILDGGAHHHWHATGALEGRRTKHFPLAVLDRGSVGAATARTEETERVTVCGPLCAPHDTWAEEILLPRAEPGDLIAVFQSGAYGACGSPQFFLGKPPAAELMVDWPVPGTADPNPNFTRKENQHA